MTIWNMIIDSPFRTFFFCYLAVANLFGLWIMGADKRRARLHRWRIPEKYLFLAGIVGGSAGTWAGMYLFRHKTKHWYFAAGMPLIFAVHVVVLFFVKLRI